MIEHLGLVALLSLTVATYTAIRRLILLFDPASPRPAKHRNPIRLDHAYGRDWQ